MGFILGGRLRGLQGGYTSFCGRCLAAAAPSAADRPRISPVGLMRGTSYARVFTWRRFMPRLQREVTKNRETEWPSKRGFVAVVEVETAADQERPRPQIALYPQIHSAVYRGPDDDRQQP